MFIPNFRPIQMRQGGLTLVELIMFIVIISVAVLGILQVLDYTSRNSVDPQRRKQALSIAEGLLEEVELAHFTYCDPNDPTADTASGAGTAPGQCTNALTVENVGPESGNARPFDNVNDYVSGFGAGGAATITSDANGAAFPATGYSATVTINPDAALGPAGSTIPSTGAAASMDVLRITVTVNYGGGNVVLDGYRTRYAPNALP